MTQSELEKNIVGQMRFNHLASTVSNLTFFSYAIVLGSLLATFAYGFLSIMFIILMVFIFLLSLGIVLVYYPNFFKDMENLTPSEEFFNIFNSILPYMFYSSLALSAISLTLLFCQKEKNIFRITVSIVCVVLCVSAYLFINLSGIK